MSAEANKALVYRWSEEVWNQGNVEFIGEIYAPTFFWNGQVSRIEAAKDLITRLHAAFPTSYIMAEDVVSDEDTVAYRWTMYRMQEATGEPMRERGITFSRVENSKVIEEWFCSEPW